MARQIVETDKALVAQLLEKVLGNANYTAIERMGGLTNRTYHVTMDNGAKYVVRIPGEGTEEMINRADEKTSTTLACDLGIDANLLYFGDDGAKVTEFIPNAITMNADIIHQPIHIEQMAQIFRKLHGCNVDTGVPFEVFQMADSYERIISDKNVGMFDDYAAIKAEVMEIKTEIDGSVDIHKAPCHNDALCENWVESDGRMYLIDWEYAGMNDCMWDLADVSIEAGFDKEHDEMFLKAYLQKDPDVKNWKHFLANKIYVDYLWTLWAKARVPYDGQPMEDWAAERYARLKENIQNFRNIMEV